MSRRGRPQPAATAFKAALVASAPSTPLAAVQSVWRATVGASVAEQAQPVGEREGVVTVTCRSSIWAQELDLMQERLRARLNLALEREGGDFEVTALRFTADGARHEV